MKAGNILGIIKFFKNKKYLKDLCAGKLYCNTSEFYRLNNEVGVGDKHEGVSYAYRKKRGDKDASLIVDGVPLPGIETLTLRGTGRKDSWLHCWTLLRMPANYEELEKFYKDISQMRQEFGPHYALVQQDKIIPFIDRIRSLTSLPVSVCEVKYSENTLKWSPECKSDTFKYQHEYRILIGECSENSVEPLVIEDPVGFHEFVQKDDNDYVFSQSNSPMDHLAWYDKGTVLYVLGRHKDAIEAYNKAIEIKPEWEMVHQAWYNKGNSLLALERFDEAVEAYNKAIEIKPEWKIVHQVWSNKGCALYYSDRFDEALEAFSEAIKINPYDHQAWYNKGNALYNLDRFDEALEAFSEVIKIKPDDHQAWYNKGNALKKLGRPDEAQDAFNKAKELKRIFQV